MAENHRQTTPARFGMRGSGAGEIVEVQGGHIVRSIGRKDRHSKVCTAKGPRDRRVRLSAHTAIQFYDVQDRLGYDRPSKAVDWLIKKAKTAIDELAELPAWNPNTVNTSTLRQPSVNDERVREEREERGEREERDVREKLLSLQRSVSEFQNLGETSHNTTSSFLPPSLDSDAIADTIKSFFPAAPATAETTSTSIQFQNYHNQDLQLSLQSFQDPLTIHHHNHHQASHQTHQNEHVLFSGGFDVSSGGWSEQNHLTPAEISRIQRMASWNAETARMRSAGNLFNPQPLFSENQFFSQRGPLQSSHPPSIRAWIDPSLGSSDHQVSQSIHQSSFSGLGFAAGGFSGLHFPARIQGEEEHDGISDKPSSASSDSRH